jgi:predicted Zn finger-like uncharacterized protein
MNIACEKCGTAYVVEEARIPAGGLPMKCSVCMHGFTVLSPAGLPALELDRGSGATMMGWASGSGGIEFDLGAPRGAESGPAEVDLADLPAPRGAGLGAAGAGAGPGIVDLPAPRGAGSGGSGAGPGPGIVDLPAPRGMGSGAARSGPAGVVDLPGLPTARPAAERADLPGLPQRGAGGARVASVPPAYPPGPPPAPPLVSAPAPGGATIMWGAEAADLPAPRPSSGSPNPLPPLLSDLPPGAELPAPKLSWPAAGATAGRGGIDLAGFDLSTTPGEFDPLANLPAPLAAPRRAAPVGIVDLPAPAGIVDLPAPAGIVDLPAPAGIVDLPAPADIRDLPAPSQNVDLPRPVGMQAGTGLDFGTVSFDSDLSGDEPPGIDLEEAPLGAGHAPPPVAARPPPTPARAAALPPPSPQGSRPPPLPPAAPAASVGFELPAGLLDLPNAGAGGGPSGPGATGGRSASSYRYAAASPAAAGVGQPGAAAPPPGPEVIRDAPPPEGAALRPVRTASSAALKAAPAGRRWALPALPSLAPLVAQLRARLGSKFWLVGAAGGLLVLVLVGATIGLATEHGFFGINLLTGKSGRLAAIRSQLAGARQELLADSYTELRSVGEALAAIPEPDVTPAVTALRAQVLAAQVARFGAPATVLADAEQLLSTLDQGEEPPADVVRARGILSLAKGEAEAAGTLLAPLEKQGDAAAAVYLGWAQLRARAFGEAERTFAAVLGRDARVPAALYGAAAVQYALNKQRSALLWAEKALAVRADYTSAMLLKARVLLAAGSEREAEQALNRLLKLRAKAPPGEQAASLLLLGELAERRGQLNVAREHFDRAVQVMPTEGAALLASGRVLLRAGLHQQAAERLRQALALDPASVPAVVLLAEAELALGRPVDARNALVVLQRKVPKSAAARTMLGRVEEAAGALDAAARLYGEAIALDAKFFDPYLYLSRLQLRRQQTSLAFETLKQAAQVIPGALTRNALGEAYLVVGDLPQAHQHFEEALALDDHLNVALFNLAETLRHEGRLEDALKRYQQLKQREAAYPGLGAGMGRLFLGAGRFAEAATAFEVAMQTDNPPVDVQLDAIRAFTGAARYSEAIARADRVLRDQPTLAEPRALRAEAHLGAGSASEALVEIQNALGRDKQPAYYVVQARIQERLRRYLDAIESYSDALRMDGSRVDWRLERARLLVRAGTVRDALKELQQVLQAQPKLAVAHLFMGIARADLGEEAQAVAQYEQALALDPRLGEAHLRLGQILLDQGRLPPAYEHVLEATKVAKDDDPWRAEAYYRLGQAAMKRQLKQQAIESFQRFLALATANDGSRDEAIKALGELGVAPAPSEDEAAQPEPPSQKK